MLRYIIKRLLYMIPTVLGVIIITFGLFHIRGGDPSKSALGQHANPKRLEEFDLERGYDKPLFFGNWGKTRAYTWKLEDGAGPWKAHAAAGCIHTNNPARLVMPANKCLTMPFAFDLSSNTLYHIVVVSRQPADCAAPSTVELFTGPNTTRTVALPISSHWQRTVIEFRPDRSDDFTCAFRTTSSTLEIKSLKLERATRGLLDSQFVFYLGQIARFDFGSSSQTNQRVRHMILDGIVPSLMLTVPMFLIGLIVEVALALVCAFYRNRFIDRFFVVISVAMMSIPYLVWIIVGQYFLAYRLQWVPVWGFESIKYLYLPVFVGIVSGLGSGVRFYRTIMLDEMYKDYVRTAFAKGVSKTGVLFKHVLKNAMIPILTSVIMTIPFLYTGSLLLERFFGIPGLGNLSINGILNSDVDVVRAVVFVGAILFVIANLITDICYALVDPRVRLK